MKLAGMTASGLGGSEVRRPDLGDEFRITWDSDEPGRIAVD